MTGPSISHAPARRVGTPSATSWKKPLRSPARLFATLRAGLLAGLLTVPGVVLPATVTRPLAEPTPAPAPSSAVDPVTAAGASQAEQKVRALLATEESPAARDHLGVALSQQGRLDEAEGEFRRAIELDPSFAAAHQHLGRLYLQQGRFEQARAQLRTAAALGPLERDLALRLAAAETADGRPDAAERQLRSVAERFDSVQALLDLARLEVRRGASREAGVSLRRAMEFAPNSEEVSSAFARLSLSNREPIPAIGVLEPLTRMHPSVPDYPYLLGVARLQIGENDGAVEALEQALALQGDQPTTLAALGLAYNNRKQFGEASAALGRALELEPRNPEALAALAEAEEGLGSLADAERHALEALSVAGDHPGAHLVVGKVRMNQQRYAEARDALERAVTADPTSAKAHYQLSLAYARLGDSESSKKHLELYREALKKTEEYLTELRTKAGLGAPGMRP